MTRVIVQKDGTDYDVTEAVKTMYDLLHSSMDWGSGFLSIEDVTEVTRLAQLCGFVNLDGADEQLMEYLRTLGGTCPTCKGYYDCELGEVTPEGRIVRLVEKVWPVPGEPYITATHEHHAILIQPPGEPASLYWPHLNQTNA